MSTRTHTHFLGIGRVCYDTPPENKLLCPKIGVAQASIDLSSNEYSAPMENEKNKILMAVLELPARQHSQTSSFTVKMNQMG